MTQKWRCADLQAAYEQVLAGLEATEDSDELPALRVTFERLDEASSAIGSDPLLA